jgi:rhodanese-related sulfurtransferase
VKHRCATVVFVCALAASALPYPLVTFVHGMSVPAPLAPLAPLLNPADGVQERTPPPRRYLTDAQWAEIEKLPEADASRRVDAREIDRMLADGRAVLLDVREPREVEDLGTIPGAIRIPFFELERRMKELPKDRVILTACNTGTGRAPRAAALLEKHGYTVGGFCGLRDYGGSRVHPPPARP